MTKKILIIEDDETAASLLASRLRHAGFDIVVAPDAVLGVRECTQLKPDLVILDLMLPAGGGVTVLRAMRQSIYTKTVPVIVLTGADSTFLKQVLEFGIQEFISKPYDAQDLIARIHKTLQLGDVDDN